MRKTNFPRLKFPPPNQLRFVGSGWFSRVFALNPHRRVQVKAEDQDLAGKIVYGTDGIVPAPSYFSLDPVSGEIRVQRDLRQDRRNVYTVR